MENISQVIRQLRREYVSHPLTKESVSADPYDQFHQWFQEVMQVDQPDPEAMTLSTATADGRVSARIVLLKGFDRRGFVFFTNYQSRKSLEMDANPQAALTFYWPALNRQVRIEGRIEKVSIEETREYFRTRPRGSQIGAWASPQSSDIDRRETIENRIAEYERRFGDDEIPCPPFWGGFLLKPDWIEFWQGRESRLHDRILYRLNDGRWKISRLAP
ncbi:MAG: pyridoxamine 5'-phosphate oxidase [Acidobacteriota bacterium]|nr:MAG: pyridoxamine 5'-phosphate oxidase [Acidobacteriota bacterium]